MESAISWFEIPVSDIDRAQRFYEALLGRPMHRETIAGQSLAVFDYAQQTGVGGCLMSGPGAPQPASQGVRIYLNAGAELDPVLARVTAAGGKLAVPRTALPPGMGFFAQVTDPDGNQVGLHAIA